jgi:GT2 family glycosyltransferase
MNVAVLSCTRDRLDYTRHCFASLRANAGCSFDHYVLDNGSSDGTREWLDSYPAALVVFEDENVGITRGANHLLDVCPLAKYDAVVRFDNDCEVITPGTLRACAEVAARYGVITAPRVHGLNHPPPKIGALSCGGRLIDETSILGGIFMAIPGFLFTDHGYRFNESFPPWTGDEDICRWWRARGGHCGYLHGFDVNHYETTNGQRTRHPGYWERRDREMGLVTA